MQAVQSECTRPNLKNGQRITVYWTDMDEWYDATHLSTRKTIDGEGDTIYESHVEYDAVGVWTNKTKYWHCLSDETWEVL